MRNDTSIYVNNSHKLHKTDDSLISSNPEKSGIHRVSNANVLKATYRVFHLVIFGVAFYWM